MGWGLGANDSANVFGTAVATRIISYKRAIILTSIFVMIGAMTQGWRVMPLFKKLSHLNATEAILAALASAITIHILTVRGIPSSSSQGVVGAVIGIGILDGTANFKPLLRCFACWVATPIGAAVISFILYGVGKWIVDRLVSNIRTFDTFVTWATILAGCYGSYSLGANSVSKVCGVYYASGIMGAQEAALLGGLGISLGVLTYSKNVMMTVGTKITALDPFSAAVSMLSAAMTVHFFTMVGVPVSTSQAAVGSVAGIGLVKGARALSRETLIECSLGWLATPIAAGVMASIFVTAFRAIFL